MKCRVCTDHSCASCRKAKQDTTGPLRDGAYTNATVVVRGGKIAALRDGTNVFHSFSDNCAPAALADDGSGAITTGSGTDVLLQSSSCIAVTGRGSSSAPYQFDPVLNPRDFLCSPEGISLKQPYAKPPVIPRDFITSVRTTTPDTVAVDVSGEGALTVNVSAAAAGVGKTRYVTYVRGTCGGAYPVWVDFVGGSYMLHVGVKLTVVAGPAGLASPAVATVTFPDLASAITAADAVSAVDDCVLDPAGGA